MDVGRSSHNQGSTQEEREQRREIGCLLLEQEKEVDESKKKKEKQGWLIACMREKQSLFSFFSFNLQPIPLISYSAKSIIKEAIEHYMLCCQKR